MSLRRLGRWGSVGTTTTHRLGTEFLKLPDARFRWLRIGRFNIIIDDKERKN